MLIELKVNWCEGSCVDDPEEVLLPWHHCELTVLRFIDKKRIRDWFCTIIVQCIIVRLVVIDQSRSFIVVQIADCHHVFCINLVWSIDIVDDERATESINVLATNVSMIPVSTRLVDSEFVDEGSTRLDRALSNHRRPISIGRVLLMETMEMDCSRLISKVICDGDNDGIAHVDTDRWVGPLSIDTDEGSLVSIWSSIYPSDTPNVVSSCRGGLGDCRLRRWA